jgi:hypothetical protein
MRNSEFVNERVIWLLGFSSLFSFRCTKRFLATLVPLFLPFTAGEGKANGRAKDASSHGMESSTLDCTRPSGYAR